ncbi:hypothetical protein M422DRAFT_277110, partial [Sphaerobolus stellatus SS14]
MTSRDNHEALSSGDLKDIQAGPIFPPPANSKGFFFFGFKDTDVYGFKNLFSLILPMITTSEQSRTLKAAARQAKRSA